MVLVKRETIFPLNALQKVHGVFMVEKGYNP